MLRIHSEHPNYGYRRVHAELRKKGWEINRKKVQRLCQVLGIQVKGY